MGDLREREFRVKLLEDTVRMCERDEELIQRIKYSCSNRLQFPDTSFEKMVNFYGNKRCYEIGSLRNPDSDLKKLRKVCEEHKEERIKVILFASTIHPGDSAIRGGSGGIETLCRISTLYPCLYSETLQKEFFENGGTDRIREGKKVCIYIPEVIGIRDEDVNDTFLHKEEWYRFDVLYCIGFLDGKRKQDAPFNFI